MAQKKIQKKDSSSLSPASLEKIFEKAFHAENFSAALKAYELLSKEKSLDLHQLSDEDLKCIIKIARSKVQEKKNIAV